MKKNPTRRAEDRIGQAQVAFHPERRVGDVRAIVTPVGDDIIVSIKPTHVAEARCLVFYRQNMRLKRVSKK